MAAPGDGDDREWRYSLEDLDDEDADTAADDDADEDADEDADTAANEDGGGEGIAGTLAPSETIEPGEIDREHALFVMIGVAIAVAFILGILLGTP